jgi:hypothetical protein
VASEGFPQSQGRIRTHQRLCYVEGMTNLAAFLLVSVLLNCEPQTDYALGASANTTAGEGAETDSPFSLGTEVPLPPDPVESPKGGESPGPDVGTNGTLSPSPEEEITPNLGNDASQCLVSGKRSYQLLASHQFHLLSLSFQSMIT